MPEISGSIFGIFVFLISHGGEVMHGGRRSLRSVQFKNAITMLDAFIGQERGVNVYLLEYEKMWGGKLRWFPLTI